MTRKKYDEILNEFSEICESNLCNSCEFTTREIDDRRYCLLEYAYNKAVNETIELIKKLNLWKLDKLEIINELKQLKEQNNETKRIVR